MVIEINNKPLVELENVAKKKVVIVPRASHLFEEAGALRLRK
jgi:hypothetical protein